MAVNQVLVAGNLTRDLEVRFTNAGTCVSRGAVAVNERRKDASGQWVDQPNFFDFVLFGDRGQKIAPYLTKGTKVSIAGRLSQSSYKDRNGNNRSKVEIVVNDIEFMSRQQDRQGYDYGDTPPMLPREQPQAQRFEQAYQENMSQVPQQQSMMYDDSDIPF